MEAGLFIAKSVPLTSELFDTPPDSDSCLVFWAVGGQMT